MRTLVFAWVLLGLSLAAHGQAAPTSGPETALPTALPADQVEGLQAVRFDPRPRQIIRNVHYVASNERHLVRFRPAIAGLGGMSIGVGAEQNYILAGWSRPEVLVLMDFDQWIVDLHRIYGAIFRHADSPEELVAAWASKGRKTLTGWLEDAVADPAERKRVLKVLKVSGPDVHRHLRRQRKRHVKQGWETILTSQEHYDFVAALWRSGRVHPCRGDLTGESTLKDLAGFAVRFKLPVRVLYLSNAEYYFTYRDGSFKENILALPFDDKSLVLHTHPRKNNNYTYYIQGGPNFQKWLARGKVKWFRSLRKQAVKSGDGDLYEITREPKAEPVPP